MLLGMQVTILIGNFSHVISTNTIYTLFGIGGNQIAFTPMMRIVSSMGGGGGRIINSNFITALFMFP